MAHGKSTVVKALSGVHTVRFKNELERNITIKLGYANAKIYRSFDKKCQRPVCYTSMGSSKEDTFVMNGFKYELVRHVSFVDCPGHDILMATMLNGAAVMDAALLLIGKLPEEKKWIVAVQQLPDVCLKASRRLSNVCLRTARRLLDDSLADSAVKNYRFMMLCKARK